MQNILVVFCGGTIGSRKSGSLIDVDEDAAACLLRKYKAGAKQKDVEFTTVQPLNMLSENLLPADWLTMFNCLRACNFQQYVGVVITHGTDTLPFSAAALSYLLHYSAVPVVMTGGNFPLADERSNGLRNFTNAVDFVLDRPASGVFVVFENAQGESVVHLGTRLTEAVPFTHRFYSINSLYFGKMCDGKFVPNEHPLNPALELLRRPRGRAADVSFAFSPEILFIKPYPGIDYRFCDFTVRKPRAVLHGLYHSGTACAREETGAYSLVNFIGYCSAQGVDFYISPVNIAGDLYLSAKRLIDAGAIPLPNISPEAGIVKLMLAYGSFGEREKIHAFLAKDPLFFENCQQVFQPDTDRH